MRGALIRGGAVVAPEGAISADAIEAATRDHVAAGAIPRFIEITAEDES